MFDCKLTGKLVDSRVNLILFAVVEQRRGASAERNDCDPALRILLEATMDFLFRKLTYHADARWRFLVLLGEVRQDSKEPDEIVFERACFDIVIVYRREHELIHGTAFCVEKFHVLDFHNIKLQKIERVTGQKHRVDLLQNFTGFLANFCYEAVGPDKLIDVSLTTRVSGDATVHRTGNIEKKHELGELVISLGDFLESGSGFNRRSVKNETSTEVHFSTV